MKEAIDTTEDAALLTIVTYPHPALSSKAKPVETVTEEIRELSAKMIDTMLAAPTGVGLAAPQVAVSLRIIVIDPSFEPDAGLGEAPFAMINPEIIEQEGSYIEDEGCLSLPGLFYPVERPEKVKIGYTDLDENRLELEVTDYVAKLVCHEIDHLDGLLLWDRVSRFKKNWLKAKYKKVAERH